MRVEEQLRESAGRHGGGIAIVAGRGRHSFAELDAKSGRLAHALLARGFSAGGRLAAFMDAGFAATVCFYAALKAGGVFNLLDTGMAAEDLARSLELNHAVAIVTDSRHASVVSAALGQARAVRLVVLAGGNLAPPTATCLSFEEVVGRTAAGPQAWPAGHEDDPAVAFGNEPAWTHRQILERAPDDTAAGPEITGAPCGELQWVLRTVAAVRAGATVVLGARSDRAIAPAGPFEVRHATTIGGDSLRAG